MKTLLASCAVAALMVAPAIAQSTIDPTTPDVVPVDPQVEQQPDGIDVLQPQTDVLPDELPPEPDMAEEVSPPVPDAEATVQAEAEMETEEETVLGAETETQADPVLEAEMADEETTVAETGSEAMVTAEAEVEAPDVPLEASVEEADLPEEYSTDDLNAIMLAQVQTVAGEITEMDNEADEWVTADGSPVDPAYAPEGQGDLEITTEEESSFTVESEDPMADPATDYAPTTEPDASTYVEPQTEAEMEDEWSGDEAVAPQEEAPVESELENDNPAAIDE